MKGPVTLLNNLLNCVLHLVPAISRPSSLVRTWEPQSIVNWDIVLLHVVLHGISQHPIYVCLRWIITLLVVWQAMEHTRIWTTIGWAGLPIQCPATQQRRELLTWVIHIRVTQEISIPTERRFPKYLQDIVLQGTRQAMLWGTHQTRMRDTCQIGHWDTHQTRLWGTHRTSSR